jgi:hypothetical protein
MQRSSPGQQPRTVGLGLRGCGFDIAPDGLSQLRARLLERPALNGQIEIKAKCFPLIAAAASNAVKVTSRARLFAAPCFWRIPWVICFRLSMLRHGAPSIANFAIR